MFLKDAIFFSDCRVQRVSGSFKKGAKGVIKTVRRVCGRQGCGGGVHRGVGGWRKRKVKRIGRFLQ